MGQRDGPLARRVVPTTTLTINTTYLTRAPSCGTRGGTGGRVRAEGEIWRREGLSCSRLMRSSKPICGDTSNSRLRIRVHRRYNRRRVRESTMGRTVSVCRNGEVPNLGSSVESVVIDRIRTGRVLIFITGPPDVANKRSALKAWRGNYSIRHHPGAFSIPLCPVLEMRMSMESQGKSPFGYSRMEQTRPSWWTEPKPARWSVKIGQVWQMYEGCLRSSWETHTQY